MYLRFMYWCCSNASLSLLLDVLLYREGVSDTKRCLLSNNDVQTANAEEELARVKPCFLHPPSHLPKPLDPQAPSRWSTFPSAELCYIDYQ
jgi:hypothetical protein